MNEEIQIFPPPIFDNNTQLSLLLTSDHEQKILSTDFIFAVDPYDLGPRGKKKGKGGGFGYMGIAPSPRPSPRHNKGMLDNNGHPYFALLESFSTAIIHTGFLCNPTLIPKALESCCTLCFSITRVACLMFCASSSPSEFDPICASFNLDTSIFLTNNLCKV
jgi:hypothetical protein